MENEFKFWRESLYLVLNHEMVIGIESSVLHSDLLFPQCLYLLMEVHGDLWFFVHFLIFY
jgi:hypothetical protein